MEFTAIQTGPKYVCHIKKVNLFNSDAKIIGVHQNNLVIPPVIQKKYTHTHTNTQVKQ